ncbi:MAG: hypothetical protein ACRDRF_24760, partial [Pseudonocardiaceae bacterium]
CAGMLAALPAARAAVLCEQVTIDLDTTDVEVYGCKKRGVAFNLTIRVNAVGVRTLIAGPRPPPCWPRT